MSNSGIYNIGIITKYNYRSLMDHLGNRSDWDLNRKNEGIFFLPPFAMGNTGVYKGKLEALYSSAHFIDNPAYDNVVVSDSTVLCNLDLRPALRHHVQSGSDVTIIANREKEDKHKTHPLVLTADSKKRVTNILIDTYSRKGTYVGMGMFIFSRKYLVDALNECHSQGLVKLERDLLQAGLAGKSTKITVFPVSGIVLRNEDVKSYYDNNMALLDKKVRDGLFLTDTPIYTKVRDEAPTYYGEGCKTDDSLIADGCRIYGSVSRSIIFRDVFIAREASVSSSLIMQGARIGKGADLECVILDKNVTVSDNVSLKGTPDHPVIIKKGETVG